MRPGHLFSRLLAVLACTVPLGAAAQSTPPPPPDPVTVDLRSRTFGGTLPFDQEFRLRGALDTLTEVVTVHYGELVERPDGTRAIAGRPHCAVWVRQQPLPGGPRARETQFVVRVPQLRLDADADYRFQFALYEVDDASLKAPPSDTQCMSEEQVRQYFGAARPTDRFTIDGDTDLEFSQRFDTDLGLVRGFGANYVGVASGVHVFLRPVNKSLDLAELGFWNSLSRRITLYAGMAVTELDSGEGVEHLMGVGSPMVGIGFRGPFYWHKDTPLAWALRPMRLNTGIMFFKQDDPNPLVDEKETKAGLFVSAAADLDLKTVLGPFVALLP